METYNHVLFFKLLHMRKGRNIDVDMPLDGSSPLLVLAFFVEFCVGTPSVQVHAQLHLLH